MQDPESSKKKKTGYYLAINFEKFSVKTSNPKIRLIRFGWIDHAEGKDKNPQQVNKPDYHLNTT